MLFIFSTPVLIRHLWQLKTLVFLHWCLLIEYLNYNQLSELIAIETQKHSIFQTKRKWVQAEATSFANFFLY